MKGKVLPRKHSQSSPNFALRFALAEFFLLTVVLLRFSRVDGDRRSCETHRTKRHIGEELVPPDGIEPPTFGLQNRCSTS